MQLFVGLGNPGAKFARNRHNVGFMALDQIAADHAFSPWRSKFDGLICEGRLDTDKITLFKAQTYMNNSGHPVGQVLRFFKLDSTDITVFHDEIDLAPGKCRLKNGGGHAGHNGLRSLHNHIGPHYSRVRIGVGHPGHRDKVAGYVLRDFAKADQGWLDDLLYGISDGAVDLAAGEGDRFMNAVALRGAPARRAKSVKSAPPATKTPKVSHQPAPPRSGLQKLLDRFR